MKSTHFLFLAALVLHFVTPSSTIATTAVNNNTHDFDALLAFKASVFDPQNVLPINWSTSIPVCNWIGITCNTRHRRVSAIDLPDMGLAGTIPLQLGNLSFLVRLNVRNNSFHGELPSELANLRRLKIISLSSNNFVGEFSILSWLGFLTRLEYLDFSSNNFSGSLSGVLSNATKLEIIDLSRNFFTGDVPEEFSALHNLKYLNLGLNQLSGRIPLALFNLSSIQRLAFSENSLSGNLPARICDRDHLPQLQGLYLSRNHFQGEIPSGIGECSKLEILSLAFNNFSGNIPREIWNLTNLRGMYLGDNHLTGQIPSDIRNLHNLQRLAMQSVDMTGELPREIGYLYKLEVIAIHSNRFRGPVPEGLFNISTLRVMVLVHNGLSGRIPSTFGFSLPNLEGVHLSGNELSGMILTSMSNASRLKVVDLADNSFSAGFVILALVISYLLIRKLRRKITPPTHVMFPETRYERVSFLELQQITNGFSDSNLLGSGTFGSVYKGIRANGMIWAVKVFDLELECAFKSFNRECEVLSKIRHRNLTKVISACSNPDFKALILEYMPNGSLEKWLYSDHHILNIMQRLDIMIDVACGLEYLHYSYSTPVVHCDLKPSNILLDQDMVGHLCDFGIAKLLSDGESVIHTKTLATFGYTAPEYGIQGLVSTMCDVYSFGITLMETFTKKRPKDEMFTEELSFRHWIQNCLSNSIIRVVDINLFRQKDEVGKDKIECVSSILQLALNCTTDTPEERMNMKDVFRALQKIKNKFFEELKS